jgi:hypothetical protein
MVGRNKQRAMSTKSPVARIVITLTTACAILLCASNAANAQLDVFGSAKYLELVTGLLARLKVASQLCGYAGIERWESVIGAIDRRYERCVAQDAGWSELVRGWEELEREAKAKGLPSGIGSLAVRGDIAWELKRAQSRGVPAYCDGFPWKWVFDPGSENAKAKADYLIKADPNNDVVWQLRLFDAIDTLSRNPNWIDKPCDRSFW